MLTKEQSAANEASALVDMTFVIKDKRYIVTPFGVEDQYACKVETRRRIMTRTKNPMKVCQETITNAENNKENLPQAMIDGMIRVAMAAQKKEEHESRIEPDQLQIRNEAESPGMLKWIIHRLIKKNNPSVTLEQIEVALSDDDVLTYVEQIQGILTLEAFDPN